MAQAIPESSGSGGSSGSDETQSVTSAGRTVHYAAHPRGRPISWIAVILMILAFLVGGIGLILHAYWLVIACGVAFCALGLFALANGIMNDTH